MEKFWSHQWWKYTPSSLYAFVNLLHQRQMIQSCTLHYLWGMEWKTGKGIQRSFSFLSVLHLLHCLTGGKKKTQLHEYVCCQGKGGECTYLICSIPPCYEYVLTVIITIIKISRYSWNETVIRVGILFVLREQILHNTKILH